MELLFGDRAVFLQYCGGQKERTCMRCNMEWHCAPCVDGI